MRNLCALAFLLATSFSVAESSKMEKSARIMELIGFYEMMEQQLESLPEWYVHTSREIISDIEDTHELSAEHRAELLSAANDYLKDNTELRTDMKKIVTLWAEHYGKHHSESDLDKLIEFYESELGRREIAATKKAMIDFTKAMESYVSSEAEFDASLANFSRRVTEIVNDCDCELE